MTVGWAGSELARRQFWGGESLGTPLPMHPLNSNVLIGAHVAFGLLGVFLRLTDRIANIAL